MKKNILTIAGFLFCSLIFAQNKNQQKVWSVDSDVYKYLSYLYVAEGHALPNSAGPWTTDELNKMLEVVEPVNIENEELYYNVYNLLNEEARFKTSDGFKFSVGGKSTPEVYVHTNTEDFDAESDWFYDFEKRADIISVYLEAYVANNFYSYSNYNLGRASYSENVEHEQIIYAPNFMSNIPYLPLPGVSHFSMSFPYRAIIAAGGEHWNFAMGRDVMRWGNGETGNLFLGGNAVYDNSIHFSTYYNSFKYSGAYIFYPHSQNLNKTSQNQSVDGIRVFMAHRMDFRFLRDKINLSIAEGVLYQNATSTFDVSVFNPMNLFHNYYTRGNGNSIMAFEADYSLARNWNLYGQFVIDEAAAFGEPNGADENPWRPSKYGYLAGAKYVKPLSFGILKMNLEGVYTNPYLYLREQYNDTEKNQGCSLYGYIREFQIKPEIGFIKNCIGYKYGGDCAVADFKASLESIGKWTGGLELFYMAHGIIDYELKGDSDWIVGKQQFLTTEDKRTDKKGNACEGTKSGEIEQLFRISVAGKYQILDWLGIDCGVDNWLIWNKDNIKKSLTVDCQTHLGVEMTF